MRRARRALRRGRRLSLSSARRGREQECDLKPVSNAIYFVLGSVFVVLAVLGAALPVLPTTPFLLLAAACYARSSRRAHAWLLRSPLFGPLIRRWQRERTVSRRAKITSIATIVLTIGWSIWRIDALAVRLVIGAIGVAVIVFLIRLPVERRRGEDGAPTR